MAIDDTCDDDSGDGDAVGDFAEEGGGGAEGGGGDVGASIAVGDDGDDEVHGDVAALEEVEGFGVGFWSVEFGDEGEEGNVAWG